MKTLLRTAILAIAMTTMTGCFTYVTKVGQGAQTGVSETGKNHYLIYGLVQMKTTDFQKLAGDATDYTVKIEHTFLDGLVNAITFGIYNPTTVTVTK